MDMQEADMQESLRYLYEVFDPSLPRLGPGDDASTARALEILLTGRHGSPFPRDRRTGVLDS